MTGAEKIPARNPVQRRRLPVVAVAGAPYERGFQHGRQCGDLIARYPDLLAEIIEGDGQLIADLVAHGAGDAQPAWFAQALQPRGDIDAVAENVASLAEDRKSVV